jgi:hypothetical protein
MQEFAMKSVACWGIVSGLLVVSMGCGSSGGGSGGGGGAGPAGSPCSPVNQNQGCLGAQRMTCDPTLSKWALIEICTTGFYCQELPDPAAPATAKRVTQCTASTTPDTTTPDTTTPDTTTPDTTTPDTTTPDTTDPGDTTEDTTTPDTTQPDTCQTTCGDKECGSDGCGGQCGKCPTAAPTCVDGYCQSQCVPDCQGKECGSNGCGGECGPCLSAAPLCVANKCTKAGTGLPKGANCYNKTESCVAGTTCTLSSQGTGWTCMTDLAPGAACGPGLGDCKSGSQCVFTTAGLNESVCVADAKAGNACWPWGGPLCDANTTCNYTSSAATSAKCYPKGGANAPCGQAAMGDCQDDLVCWTMSSSVPPKCSPRQPAGAECGSMGGCVEGSECVWQTSAKIKAICAPAGKAGDSCAAWGKATECAEWLTCVPESDAEGAPATCMTQLLVGQACGYGLGVCTPYLSCEFTDSSQTSRACVVAKGKDETCQYGSSGCMGNYYCSYVDPADASGTCVDPCAQYNLYGNGTCEEYCVDADPDCG